MSEQEPWLSGAVGTDLSKLEAEKIPEPSLTGAELFGIANAAIDAALEFVRATTATQLSEPRLVGRRKLPSTVHGLLAQIAFHTARHVGQIATTGKLTR